MRSGSLNLLTGTNLSASLIASGSNKSLLLLLFAVASNRLLCKHVALAQRSERGFQFQLPFVNRELMRQGSDKGILSETQANW